MAAVITAVLKGRRVSSSTLSRQRGARRADERPTISEIPLPDDPKDYPHRRVPDTEPFAHRRPLLRYATPSEAKRSLADIAPLDRDAAAEQLLIGKFVRWSGVVSHLEKGDSEYFVLVDCSAGGPHDSASLRFPHKRRVDVERLRERDGIAFEGQILSIDILRTPSLVQVTILTHSPGKA